MIRLFLSISLLASNLSFAQPASVPLVEEKNYTLNERYFLMKTKAQTYQDYKVIKGFVLDGVWKIVMDSVKSQKLLITGANETISQLKGSLETAQITLIKERESVAGIVNDSTHISLLGIDFKKSVFLILVAIVFSAFVLIISFIAGKMKLMRAIMKEKIVIADVITHEYEEFKRKALEKQTKLSRELQSERNKMEELKIRL